MAKKKILGKKHFMAEKKILGKENLMTEKKILGEENFMAEKKIMGEENIMAEKRSWNSIKKKKKTEKTIDLILSGRLMPSTDGLCRLQ
jgi:hypothetical protein